ncbi:hypothetical protein AYO49_06170 [Verrucomicrobiaceae bacterium SCGC AG-212-N21]|nr:hypothetical protein AYO49_06170 [Verrucomicrobiaceae bacterium SCGC AG-212-N21]
MVLPSPQPRLLLLTATSFGIFAGAFVLDQMFRWTNPSAGMSNAIMHLPLIALGWALIGLAPGLLIHGLYQWRGWQRFRLPAFCLPSIVLLALTIAELILHPVTPASRLKNVTGADLPGSAHDVRGHFSGGLFADRTHFFSFRCDPADTQRLIDALQLKPAEGKNFDWIKHPPPRWPDPARWHGRLYFEGSQADKNWYCEVVTDAAREQVFMQVYGL